MTAIAIMLAVVAVLPRFQYPLTSGRYLWAEDGVTFFDQARSAGLASLAKPYAGYLHLYPRLVAWLSSSATLIAQPVVFVGAWMIALGFMVAAISRRARAMGLDPVTICGVVLLIVLQPTSDEVFFNLTNCQWLLGFALTLAMLTLETARTPWQWIGLVVLCLTGPFCLVILPFVFVVHGLNRSIRTNIAFLGVFVACAAVQLFFLMTTDRTAGRTEVVSLVPVVKAMVKLFLFLPGRRLEWAASIGFWSVFGALLLAALAQQRTRVMTNTRVASILVAVAVAFLTAPMATGAFPVRILNDGANRYTWIPYASIVFAAALIASQRAGARLWMGACLLAICLSKFGPVERYDFHYRSFVKLSQVVPVAIPTNPLRSSVLWQMEAGPASSRRAVDDPERSNDLEGAASQTERGPDAFVDLSRRKIVCDDASDVGIEFEGDHLSDATITLSWSSDHDFARSDAMERHFEVGHVRMQYAFPYPAGGVYLRSLQLTDPKIVRLQRATVFCLR